MDLVTLNSGVESKGPITLLGHVPIEQFDPGEFELVRLRTRTTACPIHQYDWWAKHIQYRSGSFGHTYKFRSMAIQVRSP